IGQQLLDGAVDLRAELRYILRPDVRPSTGALVRPIARAGGVVFLAVVRSTAERDEVLEQVVNPLAPGRRAAGRALHAGAQAQAGIGRRGARCGCRTGRGSVTASAATGSEKRGGNGSGSGESPCL